MAMLVQPRPKPQMQQTLREPPPPVVDAAGLTPEQVARRRKMVEQLAGQASDYSPVAHWSQGLGRILSGIDAGLTERKADKAEAAGRTGANTALQQFLADDATGDPKSKVARALALAQNPWLDEMSRSVVMQQAVPKEPELTVDQRNYAAVQKDPAFGEHLINLKRASAQLPPGYMPGTTPGSLTYVPGGPADPTQKPPSETQSKDIGFLTRVQGAEKLLQDPAMIKGLQDKTSAAVRAFAPEMIGNFFVSKENQQAMVPAREWLSAFLRKDTGAAIKNEEFALYGPMYLPMPGDQADTLAIKTAARARAQDGLRAGLGPLEILAQEKQVQAGGGAAPPAGQFAPASGEAGTAAPPAAPQMQPPPDAVRDLKANPASAPQFDEIFGPGAAQAILGGQGGPELAAPPQPDPYQLQDLTRRREEMVKRHRMLTRP